MYLSNIALQLIGELKKEGREVLWQRNHPLCKDNAIRHSKWVEIGKALKMSYLGCMAMWKSLKTKHSRAKASLRLTGDSLKLKMSQTNDFLKEMDYFEHEFSEKSTKIECSPIQLPLHTGPYLSSNTLIMKNGLRVIKKPISAAALKQTKLSETNLKNKADSDLRNLNPPKRRLKERSKILNLEHKIIPLESQEKLSRLSIKRQSPINIINVTPLNQPFIDVTQEGNFEQFGIYIAAELRDLPARASILLQQELQNSIIRAKLEYLNPTNSDEIHTDILQLDIKPLYTYSSNDYDKNCGVF